EARLGDLTEDVEEAVVELLGATDSDLLDLFEHRRRNCELAVGVELRQLHVDLSHLVRGLESRKTLGRLFPFRQQDGELGNGLRKLLEPSRRFTRSNRLTLVLRSGL